MTIWKRRSAKPLLIMSAERLGKWFLSAGYEGEISGRFPIELPLNECVAIYARRLAVVIAVAALNLLILAFLFVITRYPLELISVGAIIAASMKLKTLIHNRGSKEPLKDKK